ncbi:MAG: Trm112 family protein [Desulfovibrio sp.]|jgi:uncharacterized protein YbaR (Trm112 family)|nr:Trm112 family protein [Desulfovibrio sp.]
MDKELLDLLVCPVCRAPLEEVRRGADEGLFCAVCAAVYPVRDDIPVLLAEEAVPHALWREQGNACSRD